MISKLHLSKFRNFKVEKVDFNDGTTVIIGPNASGKTNILEALFLLSTGKSFRARIEEEMISYNSDISRIVAEVGISKAGRSALMKQELWRSPDTRCQIPNSLAHTAKLCLFLLRLQF